MPEETELVRHPFEQLKRPSEMKDLFMAFYRKLPLKELRRRQGLVDAQIRLAFRNATRARGCEKVRGEIALVDLQCIADYLVEAVGERC